MRVGVLALQGGFGAHGEALRAWGHEASEVRSVAELDRVEGLVLPGGESSVQLKLLERHGLESALDTFVRSGRPVLATCAGLILAARRVRDPVQRSFGWLDIEVRRNAYGRQRESFEARADEPGWGRGLPLVFIRAPRIIEVGREVEVLATLAGEPILVRQGALFGATFHPELTRDGRVVERVFGAGVNIPSEPASTSAASS